MKKLLAAIFAGAFALSSASVVLAAEKKEEKKETKKKSEMKKGSSRICVGDFEAF